jgi:predicted enzyme related to lactoylglutathione lyase
MILVNIDVPDLERGLAFYLAAFDLHVGRRLGEDAIELLGGGVPVYLLAKAGGSVAAGQARREYGRHWTPVHLDFVVPNIDVAIARATSAGANLESAPAAAPYGKLAILSDPFGHGFCFLEFVGQGYDALVA